MLIWYGKPGTYCYGAFGLICCCFFVSFELFFFFANKNQVALWRRGVASSWMTIVATDLQLFGRIMASIKCRHKLPAGSTDNHGQQASTPVSWPIIAICSMLLEEAQREKATKYIPKSRQMHKTSWYAVSSLGKAIHLHPVRQLAGNLLVVLLIGQRLPTLHYGCTVVGEGRFPSLSLHQGPQFVLLKDN